MPSEHHYNDTESNYFLLFVVAIVVLPYTYWFVKRKVLGYNGSVESVHCRCSVCKKSTKKPTQTKQGGLTLWTIFHVVVLAVLWIAFISTIANVSGSSGGNTEKVHFDPYEILGIEYGASTEQIKKAFREMSRKHHPDKAANPNDPDVEAKYQEIVRANTALTDEIARANWEKYGNPDGPQAYSVGIALPSWLVREDNTVIVLGVYLSLLVVGLPSVVCCWWRSWKKYDTTKVMNDTMAIYYHKVEPLSRYRAIAELIAVSVENKQIPVRSSDEQNLLKATKHLTGSKAMDKKKLRYNFTVPYGVKALMLFYIYLGRAQDKLSTLLKEDLSALLLQSRNLLAGFITICTAKGLFVPLLEALYLLQLLTQGCWKGEELLQFPHITPEIQDYFATNKKRNCGTVSTFNNLGAEKRAAFLKEEKLTDEQIADVETVLAYMPHNVDFKVDIRVEGEGDDNRKVVAKSVVTCFYKVFRGKDEDEDAPEEDDDNGFFSDSGDEGATEEEKQKNKERREKRKLRQQKKKQQAKEDEVKRFVHSPYFPETKEESWWLVVGDNATQQLVGVTKVGSFGQKAEGKLKFLAPEKAGNYHFNMYLICDGYIGLDKTKTKKVVVIAEDIAKKQQEQLLLKKQAEKDITEDDSDLSDLSDEESGSESD